MAKKSRRARARQHSADSTVQKAVVRQDQPRSQAGNRAAQQAPVSAAAATIKANQYDYVAKDLVSIGIIAGALFLVLIILTFILR